MRKTWLVIAAAAVLMLGGSWQSADSARKGKKKPKGPKNIVLMIGDGMGLAQIALTQAATSYQLALFEWFKVMGFINTSSADDYITDSAAGATAFSTGVRTKNHMIGMGPDSVARITLAEKFHMGGLATGLLATCAITHATPASFFSHQVNRNMGKEIGADMPKSGIDVFMGGGWPHVDSINLVRAGFDIRHGLDAFLSANSPKVAGFYSRSMHPPKMSQGRGDFLPRASVKLLELLNRDPDGFFAMIEGSQIDWGGHDNDADYIIEETRDFDRAVLKVLEWAQKDGQTLVIVTADHETGGLTMPGWDAEKKKPVAKFSTGDHTGIPVPVFAYGPGAEDFAGHYLNTDIYFKILKARSIVP